MIDPQFVYVALGAILGIIPLVLMLAGCYCASLDWRTTARSMPMPKHGAKR